MGLLFSGKNSSTRNEIQNISSCTADLYNYLQPSSTIQCIYKKQTYIKIYLNYVHLKIFSLYIQTEFLTSIMCSLCSDIERLFFFFLRTPPFFSTIINQIISINLFNLSLGVFSWALPGARVVSSLPTPLPPPSPTPISFIQIISSYTHRRKMKEYRPNTHIKPTNPKSGGRDALSLNLSYNFFSISLTAN